MGRLLLLLPLLVSLGCGSPAPAPTAAPSTPAPPLPSEVVLETVEVTASALNVRRERSTESAVLTQVKRGTLLQVLTAGESWTQIRLADGRVGWVASRFVGPPGSTPAPARRSGCQPDSDFAFVEAPSLTFSDSSAHGLVVVEANVNASGSVTKTRIVSNNTGDEALGLLAEREIQRAKFSAPIRNCAPRAFIFTYRRTF
ncbi:MAG TPA: SH3 domain-containing protein [Thermoanaerobaculia bacterium]